MKKLMNVVSANLTAPVRSELGDYRLFNPGRIVEKSKDRIALKWNGDSRAYWFYNDQVEVA